MARREGDAAAVAMPVVGRASIDRILARIVGIGTPCRDALVVSGIDAAALVVGVGLIGEGGGEEGDRRKRPLPARQNVERQPVLAGIAGQMQRIGTAAQIVRHGPGEIRLPAAVAQIVGVEMDRAVVARRVTPALLAAGPARPDHGARRHVHQTAVTGLRADVVYFLCVNAAREVPAPQQVARKRTECRAGIRPRSDEPAQDCGVLQFAGEMVLRGCRVLGRDQQRAARRQDDTGRGCLCRDRRAVQRLLADDHASLGGIGGEPHAVPARALHRRSGRQFDRRGLRPDARRRAVRADQQRNASVAGFLRQQHLPGVGETGLAPARSRCRLHSYRAPGLRSTIPYEPRWIGCLRPAND